MSHATEYWNPHAQNGTSTPEAVNIHTSVIYKLSNNISSTVSCCILQTIMPFNNAATEFRVALFGPQRTVWTPRDVEDLQSAFREDSRLEFLHKTLGTLPSLWPQVQQAYGSPDFPAAAKLQRLQEIVAGSSSIDDTVLSNTELAPLTVITQVVDLIQQHGTSLESFEAAQGFCVGFLSAASYSSARDWQHFERNVSNAVRLAACFGIAVDMEQAASPVKVVSVRCRTPAERATLDTCLDRFPDVSLHLF